MINFLLPIPLLPFAILFGVLAAPFGHDQSSEIWLLAKIRFLLKPHLRLWDQSGQQELVTITAPKRVEEILTDGLDQSQVSSRLTALANTLDTRGWALKGVDSNLSVANLASATSDRLIAPSLPTAQIPGVTMQSTDDMLDMQNNPVARQMDQMVRANDQIHRQALLDQMEQARTAASQPTPATIQPTVYPTVQPVQQPSYQQPAVAPNAPLPHMRNRAASYGNTHVLQPAGAQPAAPQTSPTQNNPSTPMPAAPKPAILELASNDDLSVATIARQANKASGNDEVVISLR